MAGSKIRSLFASDRGSTSMSASESIPHLIASQEWHALQEKIPPGYCSSSICKPGAGNILHFACRFGPPLHIIELLYTAFPGANDCADEKGRYPLHLATKWGANAGVIKFLSDKNPASAGAQDIVGQTPLHLLCEHYASNYRPASNAGLPVRKMMHEAMKTIANAAPHAVIFEDAEDMSALEYLIASDADIKIVRDLQKRCEKEWKRISKQGEKHDEVQRNLQERKASVKRDIIATNSQRTLLCDPVAKQNKGESLPMDRRTTMLQPRKKTSARALTA